jgi:hypothetical protein
MGLGYNGVSRLDRLGMNCKSTLVSPDKAVCSSWMSWSRKGDSMVGTNGGSRAVRWIRMVGQEWKRLGRIVI